MTLGHAVLFTLLALTVGVVDRDRRRLHRQLARHKELVQAFRRTTARQMSAYRRRLYALEEDVGHDLVRLERALEERQAIDEPTRAIPRQLLRQAELRAWEASRRERFGGTPRVLDEAFEQPEAPSLARS